MATHTREEHEKAIAGIWVKAWADPGFKQRLLANPVVVLQEHGLEPRCLPPPGLLTPGAGAEPAAVTMVKVVENEQGAVYFPLPDEVAQPWANLSDESSDELSDEQLAQVAGGSMVDRAIKHLNEYMLENY